MKTTLFKIKCFFVIAILVMAKALCAQDANKPTKDLYLSYFGNDSTNLNIVHIPCHSADLRLLLAGVIYNSDTIRINGYLYNYRAPQGDVHPNNSAIDYNFPIQDTLFVREECETGRLYRYYRNYFGMGETEKLICDMSLEVGDTFVVPKTCLEEIEVEVTRVDYENGIKVIHLSEGMEFREGLFPPYFPLWQEPLYDIDEGENGSAHGIDLLCIHKDGIQVYGSDNCFPQGVEEKYDNHISIYPNVIKNNDVITIEDAEFIKDVTMTDMFGRTEKISKNVIDNNKWQISICDGQGIYFIIVETQKGSNYEKVLLLD